MFKRSFINSVCVITLFAFLGCSTARYAASIDKSMREYNVIHHVKLHDKGGWMFFGATSVNSVEFERALREIMQSVGGDDVINVVVTSSYDVDDIVITFFSLVGFLYGTRSFTVEADIIKYK